MSARQTRVTARADLRGFVYPLEPARMRAQQRHEQALHQLARCQRALADIGDALAAADEHSNSLLTRWRPADAGVIDPSRRLVQAQHLAQLAAQRSRLVQQQQQAERAVQRALDEVKHADAALRAFDEHHGDACAAHLATRARQAQQLADQDWLARRTRHAVSEDNGGCA